MEIFHDPKAILIGFLLLLVTKNAAFASPNSYDECILENIESASTDAAVAAIRTSCRNLFPLSRQPTTTRERVDATMRVNGGEWTREYFGISRYVVNASNLTDKLASEIHMQYWIVGCGDRVATRSEIRQIQRRLNRLNFQVGSEDGVIGARTVSAIQRYQEQEFGRVSEPLISREFAERLGVSIAAYDTTRRMTIFPLTGNIINPNSSADITFIGLSEKIPDGECFRYHIKGYTYR